MTASRLEERKGAEPGPVARSGHSRHTAPIHPDIRDFRDEMRLMFAVPVLTWGWGSR